MWICQDKINKGVSAVKIVPGDKCKRMTFCPTRNTYVPDEVALWMPLHHPAILSLNEVFYDAGANNWMLVTDYDPEFVDMFDYVDKNGVLSDTDAANVIRQLVKVCYYLASQGVDHRDIKDENILYNPRTKKVKLIDFGSASILTPQPYVAYQGTDVYLPPEYFLHQSYCPLPACVWALGCLAYVLLNGDCPFNTRKEVTEFKVVKWNTTPEEPARSFVELCMMGDPNTRLTMDTIINHPWLK